MTITTRKALNFSGLILFFANSKIMAASFYWHLKTFCRNTKSTFYKTINTELMKSISKIVIALAVICTTAKAQTISSACSNATGQQIVVGSATSSQNVSDGTINDPTPTACATSPSKDGWFWFDATSTSTTVVFNNTSNKDAVIYGYSGSCGSLTYMNCADIYGNSGSESVVLTTAIGSRYRVRLARYNGSGGTLSGTVGIYNSAPDSCGAAITLTQASSSSPVSYSVGSATQSLAPLTCTSWLSTCANDVWFKFVAASASPTITVAGSSGFDAVIDLRSGACNGTSVTCMDATANGGSESISCSGLTVGTTYYIRVYHWLGSGTGYPSTRNFNITVYGACSAPTAYSVTGGGSCCSGGSGATVGLGNSSSGCSYQLKLGASNVGSPVTGTGSAVSFGNQTSAGTYTVVATSGSCTATMTGSALVTVVNPPTASNAGSDQTVCGTSATLAGNNPTTGTGLWSIVSGSGGSFANASQRNTSFTGTQGNIYSLVWTISNSPCTASSDTVSITFVTNPTSASAGADQNICGTTTSLTGNTPSVGTGAWTIVSGSGGSITTASDPVSSFSGTAGTIYTLRWTVSNSPCTASTDDVIIRFYSEATANAGTDQTVCGNTALQLGGSIGGGASSATWTTSGNGTFSPNATTLAATYTPGSADVSSGLVTVTMNTNDPTGPCASANSAINITVGSNATTNAGSDQEICSTTPATLNGTMGGAASSITWTTNGDGSFSDANSLTAVYTPGASDISSGLVSLTIATDDPQGACSSSTDIMQLRVRSSIPAIPDAISGAPVSVCPPSNGIVLQTNNDPNATSYSWVLAPGNNGVTFLPVSTTHTQTINIGTTTNSGYVIRVTASNACGVSDFAGAFIRKSVGVPAAVTGASVACASSTQPYTCTSVTGAATYKWTGATGMTFNGNASPYITPDTSVSVVFPANFNTGTVCASAQVACFTSTTKCITVSKSSPALNVVAGAATACPGATETYTVPATEGASIYNWILPANTYGSSSTNTISLTIGPNFSSGTLRVTATSICGVATAPKTKSITTGVPAKPTALTGALYSACGRAVDYTVPSVSGVTYSWTVPANATINGSNNGNSINVSMPSPFSTGQVCASAVNSCGTSLSKCVTVKGIPAQPGIISCNPTTVCAYSTGVTFNVDPNSIAMGDNLLWMIPAGTTLVSGQGTTGLTLDWGASNGTVSIKSTNACGNAIRTLPITIGCLRTAPGQNSNPGTETTATQQPVTSQTENAINLQAYPDAEQKTMTFTFYAPSGGSYTYGLYDESNREVLSGNIDAVEGVNMQELDMSYMNSNAIYTLKVDNGTTTTHINVRIK